MPVLSSEIAEIYKTLLLAQKPKEDKRGHHKRLGKLISKLFDEATNNQIKENLFEKGKKEYCSSLYDKSIALKDAINYEELKEDSKLKQLLKNESVFLNLANSYRSAYYSLFYLGRAILLFEDDIDCSEHSEMWDIFKNKSKALEKKITELESIQEELIKNKKDITNVQTSIEEKRELLVKYQTLTNTYLEMKRFREIGDYSMLEEARSSLADATNFETTFDRLTKALESWKELK